MKLKGKKPQVNVETLVLPRGNGERLVFKAKAVLDFNEFEKMLPEPTPPTRMTPGDEKGKPVFDDEKYQEALGKWVDLRHAWMVLKSLEATPGLEWETIRGNDPVTWLGWRDELIASSISPVEVGRIEACVKAANCLSEKLLREARETFFRETQEASNG